MEGLQSCFWWHCNITLLPARLSEILDSQISHSEPSPMRWALFKYCELRARERVPSLKLSPIGLDTMAKNAWTQYTHIKFKPPILGSSPFGGLVDSIWALARVLLYTRISHNQDVTTNLFRGQPAFRHTPKHKKGAEKTLQEKNITLTKRSHTHTHTLTSGRSSTR